MEPGPCVLWSCKNGEKNIRRRGHYLPGTEPARSPRIRQGSKNRRTVAAAISLSAPAGVDGAGDVCGCGARTGRRASERERPGGAAVVIGERASEERGRDRSEERRDGLRARHGSYGLRRHPRPNPPVRACTDLGSGSVSLAPGPDRCGERWKRRCLLVWGLTLAFAWRHWPLSGFGTLCCEY